MKKLTLIFAILLAAALAYGQAPNTWTQKTDFGGTARYFAVGFSIGSKGYLGTGTTSGISYKDFWEYDPALNTWTQKADFGGTARDIAVGFNIGSKGYLGTGRNGDNYYKDFWEYDPALNTWTQKADFGGTARNSAVGFSIGSKGYLGTGIINGISSKDFWEYDPALNTWTQKADFGGTARYGAVGFSIGSKGYLGTGELNTPPFEAKDFWEYDQALNTWAQKADFGGTALFYAVGFSIGSKGYVGPGEDGIYYIEKDFWEYDPALNTWIQKADFGGTARSAAVGFSIGSKGYLGTGCCDYKDFWEYTPECTGLTVYADVDSDGYGDISNSYLASDCVVPTGYVTDTTDCNDANAAIFPGAAEVCSNSIDDNCNSQIDENCEECEVPVVLANTQITSTTVKLKWEVINDAILYKVSFKIAGTPDWKIVKSIDNSKTLHELAASTEYVWKVKSICGQQPSVASDWSTKKFFTTAPLKIAAAHSLATSLEIYPNPSSGHVVVHLILLQSSPVSIKIFDLNGKEIACPGLPGETLDAGDHFFSVNTLHFPKGIYFVQMISENGVQNKKLIMQ